MSTAHLNYEEVLAEMGVAMLCLNELIGKSFVLMHEIIDTKEEMQLWDEVIVGEGIAAKEVVRKRKDGSLFPALMSSALVADESGGQRFCRLPS